MIRKLALIAVAVAVLAPSPVSGQDMANAPMVRKKINWRAKRHELKPITQLGITLNDRYFHNVIINLGYDYHFLDWLGLGVNVGYAFPIKTRLTKSVEAENKIETPEMVKSFRIPATHLGLLADGHVVFSLGGKSMLFNKVTLAYDFHATVGIGVVQVQWNSEAPKAQFKGLKPESSWKLSPKVGLGFRLFFSKAVSLSVDVIDHMAYMHAAAEVSGEYHEVYTIPESEEFLHNVACMLGVSLMLPFETTHED